MKDNQKDQRDHNIPPEPKRKRRHQYQANPNNPVYSSDKSSSEKPLDKSSSVEKHLNEKLKDIEGYSGF